MWRLLSVLMFLGLFLGAGCTASNPYRPYRNGIGYDEVQLRPGQYHVVYTGPDDMSLARAAELAKVRAAEVAQAHGAPYFRVLESETDMRREVDARSTPGYRGGVGVGYGSGVGFGTGVGLGYGTTYTDIDRHPVAVLRIELLDEPAEEAFSVDEVLSNAIAATTRAAE